MNFVLIVVCVLRGMQFLAPTSDFNMDILATGRLDISATGNSSDCYMDNMDILATGRLILRSDHCRRN